MSLVRINYPAITLPNLPFKNPLGIRRIINLGMSFQIHSSILV